MRYALINPNWDFAGSVYFGCKDPHFPIELGFSRALLEERGHEAFIIDGHMEGLSEAEISSAVDSLEPDFIVIATAPSYLFWRCPQPELRVPSSLTRSLKRGGRVIAAIGPHCSVTPEAALKKLGADIVVMGEPEGVLPELAASVNDLRGVRSICLRGPDGEPVRQGSAGVADMESLPALLWPEKVIRMHTHHHHRFGVRPAGTGAEVESSRGCPYSCSFCARRDFRNGYRKRPFATVLKEIDWLLSHGVEYIYFIDEIFMPERKLLDALACRDLKFGIQTRIDLWKPELLGLLGAAGCVSVEAGVESISEKGRMLLGKKCAFSTDEIMNLLVIARKNIPFVQATLLDAHFDDPLLVDAWRQCLHNAGVWVNTPVPLFPYPGSDEYAKRWGEPDEKAWERAHEYYMNENLTFSDIQEENPECLKELEG